MNGPATALLLALTAVLAVTGGCQSTAPGLATAPPARCDAAPLQWAVGQAADEATMRRLAQQAGPVLINPVGPASVLSRDVRSDRLRVFLDAGNTITALRCG